MAKGGGKGAGKGGGKGPGKGRGKGKSKPYVIPTPFLLKGISWEGKTKHIKIPGAPPKIDSKIGSANNEHMLRYFQLLKEARVWGAQGQSRLSMEAERRANCLLKGNVSDYENVVHSERIFIKTNKF